MFFFNAFKTTVEEEKGEITFLQTVAGEGARANERLSRTDIWVPHEQMDGNPTDKDGLLLKRQLWG